MGTMMVDSIDSRIPPSRLEEKVNGNMGSTTTNNININTDTNGWDGSVVSALRPYTIQGAYQSRDGTFMYEAPNGITTFGLAAHSQIDRVAVVNWGVSIETFYL